MPCPLFLSDTGVCEAQPDAVIPSAKRIEACTRGYARHICPHAAAIPEDAAQFLIRSHQPGGIVEIAWSLESNHHPVSVGSITLAPGQLPQTTLEHQAHALASEYLRKTANA